MEVQELEQELEKKKVFYRELSALLALWTRSFTWAADIHLISFAVCVCAPILYVDPGGHIHRTPSCRAS